MLRVVKTENGIVRGIEAADPRITAFKGIPFAAPPVGENRWRAPQPCENWEGELKAYRFAPISMQDTPGMGDGLYDREWHVDSEIEMSEDCLYLNVWTPAKAADEKLPVVVWYFGGGLQWGYPSEMEFDGERVARRGIVVVTVNYRLNVFGFLAHPELSKEQPEAPTNFGSLDQKAGLDWVIRNIASFGGDPDNITIAGQSAGGGSVLSQMTCPDNKDKIKRAIIQSAMIWDPYTDRGIVAPRTMEDAEKAGEEYFRILGVKTLEEARTLDAVTLRDAFATYRNNDISKIMTTVQDGVFCVGNPIELIMKGECAHVPVMAGDTTDEFHCFLHAENESDLEEKAKSIFGDNAETFLEALKKDGKCHPESAGEVSGIECTAKAVFSKLAEDKRENGYYYRFDVDIPGWDNPGKFHSSELWFFFETLAKCWRPFTGKHYDIARQMCNYWCNFIKTGDPNGKDADGTDMPVWQPYSKENPKEMVFSLDGPYENERDEASLENFLRDRCIERFR